MFTSKIKIELELLGIPNIGKYNKYISPNSGKLITQILSEKLSSKSEDEIRFHSSFFVRVKRPKTS
jgi:hypothetical protein